MNRPYIRIRKFERARYKPWTVIIRDNRKSSKSWRMIFDTWESAVMFALKDATRIHNHPRSGK